MNHLSEETSPYLRQHADNPVEWFPWSEDAFEQARERNVPVLLSVGYSACHWCHVMAHESFENPEIAALMNENFVNIKVDREERPDVDAIYMTAVTSLTGRGGWPMTVFCDHKGRPFHGGTYWPDKPRGGMPSFPQVLETVSEAWKMQKTDLDQMATELTLRIEQLSKISPDSAPPPSDVLTQAVSNLISHHDRVYGGFGNPPKFPQAMNLDFLLRCIAKENNPSAEAVMTFTLSSMSSGGIYDHLGGGFSRYSVDERWLIPHFEKMLYDNAMLSRVYLHAWKLTGDPRWLQVTEETIEYVLRDLCDPLGGFYSAEDADSEGVEGKFYVWSEKDLRDICGEHADDVIDWYGVTSEGNFEGSNILYRQKVGDLIRPSTVEEARQILFEKRKERVRPGLDNKVLTEWNGLMLATLSEAAAATGRNDWLEAAKLNGDFLWEYMRNKNGRWLRAWQPEAGSQHLAYAADYAAIIDGFTRLGEATGEKRWTEMAIETANSLIDLFEDHENGGFFTSGNDADPLITRMKDIFDNAIPSANSLAAVSLLRLGSLTGQSHLIESAEKILQLVSKQISQHPTGFGHLLGALDIYHSGSTEVLVTGNRPDLLRVVNSSFLPNVVLAWGESFSGPLWENRTGDQVWVCRNFECELPLTKDEDLEKSLKR
jgi:hypothetical protein